MKSLTVLGLVLVLTICDYCGKDFQVLGRHRWRCSDKLNNSRQGDNHGNSYESVIREASYSISDNNSILSQNQQKITKCCCGKPCKGLRGLKIHQRSCRVILGLGQEITDAIIEAENEEDPATVSDTEGQIYDKNNEPILKAGIKLPKSAQQWKAAEDHFREALPLREISPNCLNENIEQMNRSLYDYFVRKFGKENDRCPSELAE